MVVFEIVSFHLALLRLHSDPVIMLSQIQVPLLNTSSSQSYSSTLSVPYPHVRVRKRYYRMSHTNLVDQDMILNPQLFQSPSSPIKLSQKLCLGPVPRQFCPEKPVRRHAAIRTWVDDWRKLQLVDSEVKIAIIANCDCIVVSIGSTASKCLHSRVSGQLILGSLTHTDAVPFSTW